MGCARDQALLARYVSSGARASELRNIRNDIEIGYDADLSDVDVLVQDALDRRALIPDDSDVTVDTRGNTVTLGREAGSHHTGDGPPRLAATATGSQNHRNQVTAAHLDGQ
jgi:hypothetical protein